MRQSYGARVAIKPGTHTIGPAGSELLVKTYREGVAAKAGHDLVIEVTNWEATVDVGEDGSLRSMALSAEPGSLRVRDGGGGAKPLTAKDRGDIEKTIAKVLGPDPITFRSDGASLDGSGRLHVEGELGIGGSSQPAGCELAAAEDGTVGATTALTQSHWGIKPYRGLMGALKVRDSVEVVLGARLPAA
jgi:polyisoprenoid-binding protein YceI